MKIEKFNKFFESNHYYLSPDDIEDIFSDLVDDGFQFELYSGHRNTVDVINTSYYFKVSKRYSSKFEYLLSDDVWGCTDLKSINNEITKILNILEDIKLRLDKADYVIAFEPEFSFAEDSMIDIICHCQHKSNITYDE